MCSKKSTKAAEPKPGAGAKEAKHARNAKPASAEVAANDGCRKAGGHAQSIAHSSRPASSSQPAGTGSNVERASAKQAEPFHAILTNRPAPASSCNAPPGDTTQSGGTAADLSPHNFAQDVDDALAKAAQRVPLTAQASSSSKLSSPGQVIQEDQASSLRTQPAAESPDQSRAAANKTLLTPATTKPACEHLRAPKGQASPHTQPQQQCETAADVTSASDQESAAGAASIMQAAPHASDSSAACK